MEETPQLPYPLSYPPSSYFLGNLTDPFFASPEVEGSSVGKAAGGGFFPLCYYVNFTIDRFRRVSLQFTSFFPLHLSPPSLCPSVILPPHPHLRNLSAKPIRNPQFVCCFWTPELFNIATGGGGGEKLLRTKTEKKL